MIALTLSFLALIAAPALYRWCSRRQSLMAFMDGFIFVAVTGLLLVGVLPSAFQHGGWWVFPFLVAGLILPVLTERLLHHEGQVQRSALILALSGLVLHAITDGAAIAHGHGDQGGAVDAFKGNLFLNFSVLLHRLPIALTIWWFSFPLFGPLLSSSVLALVGAGTVLGYAYAPGILEPLSTSGMAYFQAFVAGSLMHILVHRSRTVGSCGHDHGAGTRWPEGLGNALGALLVFSLASDHHSPAMGWLDQVGKTLYSLALESAPALLLAYLIAGIAVVFMPASYINWLKTGRSWRQSLRGMAVGLPLPVCSCGVVPLYHMLIRKGAPPVAAMTFLIATPELGIDAILLSLPLLGEQMTLLRVAAAALVAMGVGILVGRITSSPVSATENSCCDSESSARAEPWDHKLKRGLRYGLGELVDHTAPWIVAGLLIAASVQPLLSQGLLDAVPAGFSVLFFALLGMPVYVCASGATPLVAVFLATGVSPGAALAFLITGPATNMTTLGVLSRLHGRRIALLFGVATLTLTVGLGYLTDFCLLRDFQPQALRGEQDHASMLQLFALSLLTALYLYSLLRRGARAFLMELFSQGESAHQGEAHGHAH